jgi:myotubularin-related protein 6/7/8
MQDEKLIEAIFTSHLFADPNSATAQAALAEGRNSVSTGNAATDRGNIMAIYGATTTNLIIDARPTTNAMANRAKGAGTENMEHYKGCKKVYLGVDNIHVMRDSLQKVTTVLRASEPPWTFGLNRGDVDGALPEKEALPLDYLGLKRSSWLKHISALLEGTAIITRNIHVNNSHVLIHCSDGWDRTSQLAALAEICLDPYYRTMRGFAVLVEKDWCSFGHRFWDRCGHASSDKYFHTAHGYGEENSEEESGEEMAGGFEPQAAANAIWGFTKQFTANFQSSGDGSSHKGHGGAHLKETSPVFHQFLDCIWQLMRQYPTRFEFNEQWLLDIYDGVYECKYGTFLFNSESERNGLSDVGMKPPASARSFSIWDYLLDDGKMSRFSNTAYDAALDVDTKRVGADMGVLLPNSKDVGFWGGVFRREGKEINKLVQAEAEERKRLVEALARQRTDEINSGTPLQVPAEGPEEVDGVTIGPVVRNGQDDPLMRNGVVDLSSSKGDQQGLTYQPYQSRQRPGQPVKALERGEGYASRPFSASPAASSTSSVDEGGMNAQDAAAKMKNLFLGWGAKFQDAYANATAVPDEQPRASYASRPAAARSNSTMARDDAIASTGRATLPQMPPKPPPKMKAVLRDGEDNPWAVKTNKSDVSQDELPDSLAYPISTPSKMGNPSEQRGEPDKKDTQSANYDPLGVGTL